MTHRSSPSRAHQPLPELLRAARHPGQEEDAQTHLPASFLSSCLYPRRTCDGHGGSPRGRDQCCFWFRGQDTPEVLCGPQVGGSVWNDLVGAPTFGSEDTPQACGCLAGRQHTGPAILVTPPSRAAPGSTCSPPVTAAPISRSAGAGAHRPEGGEDSGPHRRGSGGQNLLQSSAGTGSPFLAPPSCQFLEAGAVISLGTKA